MAAMLALCWACLAQATDGWIDRHFTTADGLPVSSAAAARVDQDGFLWLATHDGLVRFDGRKFVVHDLASDPQLQANRFVSLHKDQSGNLYAYTNNATVLSVRSNAIGQVFADPVNRDAPVIAVYEAPFCLLLTTGYFCHDNNGRFQPRLRFDPNGGFRHVVAQGSSTLWMVDPERGVERLSDGAAQTVLGRDAVADIASNASPIALNSEALAIGLKSGLLIVSADGKADRRALPAETPANESVIHLRQADDDHLLVGTNRHLYRHCLKTSAWQRLTPQHTTGVSRSWIDPNGATWIQHGNELFSADGLILETQGLIQDVYIDAEQTAWISTLRDGIHALSTPRVQRIDQDNGLPFENVYGVSVDLDGRIWTGSLDGGIQVIDDDKVRFYDTDHGLPGDNPWTVLAAADGTIYTAPYRAGLYAKPMGEDDFQAVELPDALEGVAFRALTIDASNRLWLGGSKGVWIGGDSGWSKHWPNEGDSPVIYAILHAEDGSTWYGTNQGLWHHRGPVSQRFAEDAIAGSAVRGLYQASDRAIWASTQGRGLIRIANNDHQPIDVIRLGQAQGLPSNSPHAVFEDSDNNLWVNSNQGIFRINRNDLQRFLTTRQRSVTPLLLTQADGLHEWEGNGGVQPSIAHDQHGRFWLPGQAGLVGIDPATIVPRGSAPTPVIDAITTESRRLSPGPEVLLPLGERTVSLRYTSADLLADRPGRFRYRLTSGTGSDASKQTNAWIDALDAQQVTFNRLSPGHYRFDLLAANSDGVWSKQAESVVLSVPAFWYETLTARLTAIAITLAIIAWLVHWRIRALHSQTVLLNARVEQRTRQLADEKTRAESAVAELADANGWLEFAHKELIQKNSLLAQQAQRLQALDQFRKRVLADVGHELRTPLMLVEMPLQQLAKQLDRAPAQWTDYHNRQLTLACQQTQRLNTLVNQLLSLIQAQSGQLTLRFRRIELQHLVRTLAESYRPLADRDQVSLVVKAPENPIRLFADSHQLTTAIGNLVDNAICHTPSGSMVTIRCEHHPHSDSLARVSVSDQGSGFQPGIEKKLFQRFYRDTETSPPRPTGLGIGLALAREIVELHGGQIGAENHTDAGACFWMALPMDSCHVAIEDIETTASSVSMADPRPPSSGGGIALVEDHPDMAAYLSERLSDYFPVSTFASAEAGLNALLEQPYGMLLSDVRLPGINGIELCRRVRQTPKINGLAVILFSAQATSADQQAGARAGANEYLLKPFSLETLLSAIQRHWPAARARVQAASHPQPTDPLLRIGIQALTDGEFGVSEWAASVHLSPRQLRRRITDLVGMAPLAWLREQRLLRVRALVSSGECKTLAEAGQQCGLDNPPYLYRIYRARFGES